MILQKQVSILCATLFLILSLSPLVEAREAEQSVDLAFVSLNEDAIHQNMMSEDMSDIKSNLHTWALNPLPTGVYSGALTPESILQIDYEVRPDQRLGNQVITATGPVVMADADFTGYIDVNGMGAIRPQVGGFGPHPKLDQSCPGCDFPAGLPPTNPDDWSWSSDDVNDPYGMNDPGVGAYSFSDLQPGGGWDESSQSRPMVYHHETNIPHWGRDSFHSYIAVATEIQFTPEEIMSGASEFWVRTPLDGSYDPESSFFSIYEVPQGSGTEFTVIPNAVENNSASQWDDYYISILAGETGDFDTTEKALSIEVPNGKLVYETAFGTPEVPIFDYSTVTFAEVNNMSGDPWADPADSPCTWYSSVVSCGFPGGVSYLNFTHDYAMANNLDLYGSCFDTHPQTNVCSGVGASYLAGARREGHGNQYNSIYGHQNQIPSIVMEPTAPVSSQTQHLVDLAVEDSTHLRTYHRANTFIYPNQPYLFVVLIALTDSFPTLALTQEDIFEPGTDTYVVMGEYNYSNPDTDGDGSNEYWVNPTNHYSDGRHVPFDAGWSFIFTQGQSQDMAGYRFRADNTTMMMLKPLGDTIQHEPGHDGKWGTSDDMVDFVSLYLPYINHGKKPITIEYIAYALEKTTDDEWEYRPWYNMTDHGSNNDWEDFSQHVEGTGLPCGDYWGQRNWGSGYSMWNPETRSYMEMDEDNDGLVNEDWNDDIDNDGDGLLDEDPPACKYGAPMHNYYYSGFSYFGTKALSGNGRFTQIPAALSHDDVDMFKSGSRLGEPLNDKLQDSETFSKQHTNYYLHTSELIPANGTTHILYMVRFAGTFHWQANLENTRYYTSPLSTGDEGGPFDPSAKFSWLIGGQSGESTFEDPFFYNTLLDTDPRDGRTDGVQDNATDITLLIHAQPTTTLETTVTLPIYGLPCPFGIFNQDYDWLPGNEADVFQTGCTGIPLYNGRGGVEDSDWESRYQGTVYPNRLTVPAGGFQLWDTAWDKENGERVDGQKLTELLSSSWYSWLFSVGPLGGNGISLLNDLDNTGTVPDWLQVQNTNWHQQKLMMTQASTHAGSGSNTFEDATWGCGDGNPDENPTPKVYLIPLTTPGIGDDMPWYPISSSKVGCYWPYSFTAYSYEATDTDNDPAVYEIVGGQGTRHSAFGWFEVNARGASYTRAYNHSTHNTEVFASASITNGRWTEVEWISGTGINYLDNSFAHKLVHHNTYKLTIYADTIPVYPETQEEINQFFIEEEGEDQTAWGVVEDIFDDLSNSWGSMSTAEKALCVIGAPLCLAVFALQQLGVDFGETIRKLLDGAHQLGGWLRERFDEAAMLIGALGGWLVQFAVDFVGTIYHLFEEIGSHMDEVVLGLVFLAGLAVMSFFLQTIIRLTTTLMITIRHGGGY